MRGNQPSRIASSVFATVRSYRILDSLAILVSLVSRCRHKKTARGRLSCGGCLRHRWTFWRSDVAVAEHSRTTRPNDLRFKFRQRGGCTAEISRYNGSLRPPLFVLLPVVHTIVSGRRTRRNERRNRHAVSFARLGGFGACGAEVVLFRRFHTQVIVHSYTDSKDLSSISENRSAKRCTCRDHPRRSPDRKRRPRELRADVSERVNRVV